MAEDPSNALAAAEEATGALRERWVNENIVQDEYGDFVRAGRPSDQCPDGRPWPSRGATGPQASEPDVSV